MPLELNKAHLNFDIGIELLLLLSLEPKLTTVLRHDLGLGEDRTQFAVVVRRVENVHRVPLARNGKLKGATLALTRHTMPLAEKLGDDYLQKVYGL